MFYFQDSFGDSYLNDNRDLGSTLYACQRQFPGRVLRMQVRVGVGPVTITTQNRPGTLSKGQSEGSGFGLRLRFGLCITGGKQARKKG